MRYLAENIRLLLATLGLLAGSLPLVLAWPMLADSPSGRVAENTIAGGETNAGGTTNTGSSTSTGSASDEFGQTVRPFLTRYCLDCHTGEAAEAGLDLSQFDSQVSVNDDLDSWTQIIEAIDDQYMPPSEAAQPPPGEVARLKDWYQKTVAVQRPPRVPNIRRLNRVEYENTVRDLLRMETDIFANAGRILLVDDYFRPASGRMPRYVLAMSHFSYLQKRPPLLPEVSEVPTDPPVEHGFSNDHTSLSFSPLQVERYLDLASSIVNSVNFPRLCQLWDSLFLPPENASGTESGVQAARQRLETLLERAFRRPATPVEVDRFVSLFRGQLESGGSFTEAMKTTVTAVLVSPSFLFRQDFAAGSFDETGVDQFALASRLSYFLWASMPDEPLFQAAREGRLATPEELRGQVRRMMRDRKIKSLATDFGMQWLQVAKVISARPDRDLFPGYYENNDTTPGVSMMIEQLLFFETVMVEDRNILEFVHSDFAYLNRQLMNWYQLDPREVLGYTPPADSVEDFFRIRWSNRHRGGVITSGATLLSTSATTRTSPIYRGAWMLDVIFNRPPPAPPADVPALDDSTDVTSQPISIRDKLSRHRRDPACAVCHDRIDPMGFALEKFDAIGRFRKQYENGLEIDATGEVFEERYDGAARFKAIILRHSDNFVRGFAEHMLKYALGRRLEIADEKFVDQMLADVAEQDNRFSAVVEAIVLSDLFRLPPAGMVSRATRGP